MAESEAQNAAGEGRAAGRGVAFIAGAKVYFMLAGLATEFVLPNILGNAMFGAWVVVKQTVSLINNVLIAGTIQMISRFVAQRPGRATHIHGAGLSLHLRVGLPIALAFAAGAPLFGYFYKDSSKVGPLILAGVIVGLYAFYAVFVGVANGKKQFHKQAVLDVTFATLRTGLIIGLAAFGLKLYGILSGWVAAAVVILIAATYLIGRPAKRSEQESLAVMGRFLGSVSVYLLLLNIMMMVDVILLKRLATDYWMQIPDATPGAASKFADHQAGYYGKAANFARVTYQALIAVTFVIFPLMSRATFAKENATAKKYVETSLRYSLVFGAIIAVVLIAAPGRIIGLIYGKDSAVMGGSAMAILSVGYVMFSMFAICGAILNGAGRTMPAIISGVIGCSLGVILVLWLVPNASSPIDMLDRAAIAIAVAMALGGIIAVIAVCLTFSASPPLLTVVRIAVSGTAAVYVTKQLPDKGAMTTLAACLIAAGVFVAGLIVLRELTKADLKQVLDLRRSVKEGEP